MAGMSYALFPATDNRPISYPTSLPFVRNWPVKVGTDGTGTELEWRTHDPRHLVDLLVAAASELSFEFYSVDPDADPGEYPRDIGRIDGPLGEASIGVFDVGPPSIVILTQGFPRQIAGADDEEIRSARYSGETVYVVIEWVFHRFLERGDDHN